MSTRSTLALTIALSLYAVTTLFSMAAMSIGAFVVLCVLFVAAGGARGLSTLLRAEWRNSSSRLYLRLALLFALALLSSLIGAYFWPLSYDGHVPDIRFLRDMAKSWYLLWPFVLVVALRLLPQKGRQAVIISWLVAFTLLSCVGIFQYFTGWPRPQPIPPFWVRYHATLFLGHHLSVASIFIFPFFAALAFLRAGRLKWFMLFAVLVGATTLILGFSRMLWVALPLGLCFWLLLNLRLRWSVSAVVAVAVAAFVAYQEVPQVRVRLHDSLGVSTRQQLWLTNLEFFKARPLTGIGWHQNQPMSGYYMREKFGPDPVRFVGHAHNNFLEILGGTGLFGALAWLAWWAGVLVLAWRARKISEPTQFALGVLAAFFVFHLNGLTQVNFWEAKVLHQLTFVIAWVLLWVRNEGYKSKHG